MTLIGLLCAQENCPCRYNNMLFSNTGNMAFVPAAAEDNDLPPSFPSVFPTSSAPHQEFQGISSVLMRRAMSFDHQDSRAGDIDMSDDDGSSQLLGEKKRRLNLEQVKALERSFEIGNKLEPERKMQLARALGLKPRQIAIWFQNRRARCKTKQLEKDYEILKRQCDKIKADNDALKTQNKKLHSELQLTLRNRESAGGTPILFNLNKENEGSNWNNGSGDENGTIIDVNLGTTTRTSSTNSPHNNHDVFPTANFKIEQTVPGEGFFNMFTNVEDQTNFWPLPVQQHFY